jgi:hypothetical protein
MSTKKGVVTQTGADAYTSLAIPTGLTADGKAGWEITGLIAYWSNQEVLAPADMELDAILATISTVTTFDSIDEITRINFGISNTAGVAVAFPIDMIKQAIIQEPRLTVQPNVYLNVSSTLTGGTNVVYWELAYNIVKLTDLDVLRLLQGGA